MRPRTLLALALAAVLTLAACSDPASSSVGSATSSGATASGGIYKLGISEPDSKINPQNVSDFYAMFVVGLASEGLISQDNKGELIPRLATSWEPSSDGLTWTVKIRPGVKFSNGAALTADDVAATFSSITAKDSLSPGKSSFDGLLSKVTASGDAAVFTLSRPFSDFPYLLTGTNTTIQPAGFSPTAEWLKDPVGAGQFKLEKFTPGVSVTYTKNPDYWDAKNVKLDGVELRFFADEQAELLAFQSGEIDQVTTSPTALQTLDLAQYRRTEPSFSKFDGIFLNVKQPPLNDVKVRQALAWSLDRPAIVKTVYGDAATVANDELYFPNYAVQPKGLPQRQQDLAKVKELLGGRTIDLTITTLSDEKTLAQVVQQQLQATGGFKVKLKVLTSAQYYADGKDTPWLSAPVTITNWAQRLPSQYVSLIFAKGAAWNASKYDNPALEKLSAQYDATTDSATRQSLADQIAKIQYDDVAAVVPAFVSGSLILSKKVSGDFASGQDFWGGFDFRQIAVAG